MAEGEAVRQAEALCELSRAHQSPDEQLEPTPVSGAGTPRAPIPRTQEQLCPGRASPRVFFFKTGYLQCASPNSRGRCCILRHAVSCVHNCSQDRSKNSAPSPFLPHQESPDMSSNDVMCQNFLMTLSPLIPV